IQDVRGPVDHGRLSGEVRGTRGVHGLRTLRRVVLCEGTVEVPRGLAGAGVQSDLAALVDELAVIAQRERLEGLRREDVRRVGRKGDAVVAAGGQSLRRLL